MDGCRGERQAHSHVAESQCREPAPLARSKASPPDPAAPLARCKGAPQTPEPLYSTENWLRRPGRWSRPQKNRRQNCQPGLCSNPSLRRRAERADRRPTDTRPAAHQHSHAPQEHTSCGGRSPAEHSHTAAAMLTRRRQKEGTHPTPRLLCLPAPAASSSAAAAAAPRTAAPAPLALVCAGNGTDASLFGTAAARIPSACNSSACTRTAHPGPAPVSMQVTPAALDNVQGSQWARTKTTGGSEARKGRRGGAGGRGWHDTHPL